MTDHYVRYHELGRESGPFDDDERQALEGTARVPLFWRTERSDAQPSDDMTCEDCGGHFKRSEGFDNPPRCVYCGVAHPDA